MEPLTSDIWKSLSSLAWVPPLEGESSDLSESQKWLGGKYDVRLLWMTFVYFRLFAKVLDPYTP